MPATERSKTGDCQGAGSRAGDGAAERSDRVIFHQANGEVAEDRPHRAAAGEPANGEAATADQARGTARRHRVIARERGTGPGPEPPPAPEPLPGDTTPPPSEPQPIDRRDAGA